MAPPDISGTIHLVRHGSVENPKAILYGRLPGFHLSELGRRQAEAAAERLADAGVTALWASPLERAQETAGFFAKHHGLDIVSDDRLLESDTRFEGIKKTPLSILSPRNWWRLRNPLKPSWGESFAD
ncbi:MAG: histidine phosphatase family protein, partial [Actinobacteria bacterium]|nr:histidine phosphatase family protein [Actinomycetota bacterium]